MREQCCFVGLGDRTLCFFNPLGFDNNVLFVYLSDASYGGISCVSVVT